MQEPTERNNRRLLHILEACRKIKTYKSGFDQETFLGSGKTLDAVIYQLIIIGEAVAHIDQHLLEKYDYPWYKARAFRNYAAHEYFNLDMWLVWGIVESHLDALQSKVEEMLENEF